MYYYPMMDVNDWGFGLMMMLLGLLFLVAVVTVTFRLLKSNETDTRSSVKPLDVAKERYAKGDITKHEFDQLKKDLTD